MKEFYPPYYSKLTYVWHQLTKSHFGDNTDAILLFEPTSDMNDNYWAHTCSCGLKKRC